MQSVWRCYTDSNDFFFELSIFSKISHNLLNALHSSEFLSWRLSFSQNSIILNFIHLTSIDITQYNDLDFMVVFVFSRWGLDQKQFRIICKTSSWLFGIHVWHNYTLVDRETSRGEFWGNKSFRHKHYLYYFSLHSALGREIPCDGALWCGLLRLGPIKTIVN